MKKSLLALAVMAFASSSSMAATVYDKDGTELYLDGRVMSVFYSPNFNEAAESDATIKNSGRFGIGGVTKINSWLSGIGYAQWDVADGSADDNHFRARQQFVGLDFGDFGRIVAGRVIDATYFAEELTDVFEDVGAVSQTKYNSEFRNSQLNYVYENYGVIAALGVQFAADNAKIWDETFSWKNANGDEVASVEDSYAVDSGFTLALGYTFENVLFGPLSIRAGYTYLRGQDGNDLTGDNSEKTYNLNDGSQYTVKSVGDNGVGFRSFKHVNAGIGWGDLENTLYVAVLGEYARMEDVAWMPDTHITERGMEFVVGYGFGNGLSVVTGYSADYFKSDCDTLVGDTEMKIKRRVPVFVDYKFNSNFDIWTELEFNAGSKLGEKDPRNDSFIWSLGARYTF